MTLTGNRPDMLIIDDPQAPNDIPVLLSAPMVVATWSGLKTMTRRLAMAKGKLSKKQRADLAADGKVGAFVEPVASRWQKVKPGDRLWVRERLRCGGQGIWRYHADDMSLAICGAPQTTMVAWAHHEERESVPSIHMPKWASRMTLIVKTVKIERLRSISFDDCKAEGFSIKIISDDPEVEIDAARDWFSDLWESLHGPTSFRDDPLVVAIGFEAIKKNIRRL